MTCSVQIKISVELKKKLDDKKVCERETYCDVIEKLIEEDNGLEQI